MKAIIKPAEKKNRGYRENYIHTEYRKEEIKRN
jgi:hypothetical protein